MDSVFFQVSQFDLYVFSHKRIGTILVVASHPPQVVFGAFQQMCQMHTRVRNRNGTQPHLPVSIR